ncbi:MAG: DUF6580 family putative transport protein [Candidatus Omnitrophota bacterium]|jgi:hypothetical protein
MLAIFLIIAGILLRVAPHSPNFTPVAAIALFGGCYLRKKYALIVPLALMIVSDLAIGLHDVFIFTWGGFLLVSMIGLWLKNHKGVSTTVSASLVSSVIFYIVSNFGVWLMGYYPRNPAGLISCYAMALPFLRAFTFSTLFYTAVFFGIYELTAYFVKDTKLSKVLLTN